MEAAAARNPVFGEATPTPGSTVLVGLVGKGIQKSRSPAMHEAEGRRQKLNYVYTLLDTDLMGPTPPALSEILRFAELFGYRGLNITYPYKQAVLDYLDELSENAEAVGSVNTVVFRNGRKIGHNTDMWGFSESFRLNLANVSRDTVLLLGAGGAGSAVAYALLESGVGHLRISDIDMARAQALAASLAERYGTTRIALSDDLNSDAAIADGVVNTTPVGMVSLPGTPIAVELIRPQMWIADIIYFPLETEFLRAARLRGCPTMDGADMAIFQAAWAFEHFTGLSPDIDRMRADFAAQTESPH